MRALAGLVTSLGRLAIEELLPARCGACGRFGAFLCDGCRSDLVPAVAPRCDGCWQRIAGRTCPRCAAAGGGCTAIRACFVYDGAAKRLVASLKYAGHHALAAAMAGEMVARWRNFGLQADAVVPVPLHPRRQRQRGFNQAALLAATFGRSLAVEVIDGPLVRRRPTPPQARTGSAEERRANVYGAFACVDATLAGRRVLLVDDVTTTGATFGACAAALVEAGAEAVYGCAFAVAG